MLLGSQMFSGLIAGISVMMRVQTSHPLDPLSAAEISVAVATVRAAGATPEVSIIVSLDASVVH